MIAADIAAKASDVEIGFLDRFTGSVVISGDVESVDTAPQGCDGYAETGAGICGRGDNENVRKKRIMIIGPGKSGKTTLAAWLEDSSDIRRVQNMVYRKNTLDTPGAYLESPWMHHHLIVRRLRTPPVW